MLQYLIILLDDKSVSYCHYENSISEYKLINLEILKKGILFAMKENLMIQFVYPDYEIPSEYKDMIETIDHSKIVPASYSGEADVIVLEDWDSLLAFNYNSEMVCVLRTSKNDFFKYYRLLNGVIDKVARLNVILTDIGTFIQKDFDIYKSILDEFALQLTELYRKNIPSLLNLLTDRMILNKMNNCNAGWENITLAPNGMFYVCPAFYQTNSLDSIGSLESGLDIKNPQLYRLDYAPLCRNCDAYQCKRCVWMNRKTTLEVNTPSHEQCVIAHLERNASRFLLSKIRQLGEFLPESEIKQISYLDPFDIKESIN
jgi:CXXX repeat peptide maturase